MKMIKSMEISHSVSPPLVGQREDGSWYWLDETYNEGDDIRHKTREDAVAAQTRYCDWLMGEVTK